MYNIVIGATKYGEMIIDLLRQKDKLVIASDKNGNYKAICPVTLEKDFISREME